jgi:ferredoxin-NADP reductase/CRP-like cAMP-binding protein/fatty acid desaturase
MTPSFAEPLRATGLFDALTPAELEQLALAVTRVEIPAGTTFVREGDRGADMYVILEGSVRVFTATPDGQEIVLNTRGPGAYLGEQALLPGGSDRRNASVRADEDLVLLRVMKQDFQRALAKDSPLKDQLLHIGTEQVRHALRRQSALFRSLEGPKADAWSREVDFADGATVFAQGDPGDACYVIRSGTAVVYENGGNEPRARLGAGQFFGELALLQRAPRSATVRAEGQLRVLRIEGEHFLRMYEGSPEIRAHADALQKVYPLRRGVTTQYAGKFMGMDCITTMHHADDISAVVSRVIGQDIFAMSVLGAEAEGAETLHFQDAARGVERELVLAGGRIVEVKAQGPWEELGEIHRQVLDRTPLVPAQVELFRRTGALRAELAEATHHDDEIVCHCMEVRRGTLRRAIQSGCHTVEALADAHGASTVCGGCRFRLQEMVGRADWAPVVAFEVIRVTDDTWTFRFRRGGGGALPAAKPGQHIVVQAMIDGRWVERPYTLTSASAETGFHEITVKHEEQGVFSRWMAAHCREETLIRISPPQGTTVLDLAESRPVVCLVAGIGMTPALAMCRSILREGSAQPLHVHYTVRTRDRAAYADELRQAAAQHPHIRLTLRVTADEGRLSRADVENLVRDAPDARFYLCGPTAYIGEVKQHLEAARVPAERIAVEAFKHVGGPVARKAAPSPAAELPAMPYKTFVEKVLTREIALPKAADIAARIHAERPEIFAPDNAAAARILAFALMRVAVAAALIVWSASHGWYWLMALMWVTQGVNYYALAAIGHEFVHDAGFDREWLNKLAGSVVALPLLCRFGAFRNSHLAHHRHNQSVEDPKVPKRTKAQEGLASVLIGRVFLRAPILLQNLALLAATLFAAPYLMVRFEFSPFRPIRKWTELLEILAMVVLWGGTFAALGGKIAAAVLLGPMIVGWACVALVFLTHTSEYTVYPQEFDPDEYELMIFNINNLTVGSWLDRIGCYFHRYHVEHHLLPTVPFYRLAQVSELVCRDYRQFMLPLRRVGFEYVRRGLVDRLRDQRLVEIAGKRYRVGSLIEKVTIGGSGSQEIHTGP